MKAIERYLEEHGTELNEDECKAFEYVLEALRTSPKGAAQKFIELEKAILENKKYKIQNTDVLNISQKFTLIASIRDLMLLDKIIENG